MAKQAEKLQGISDKLDTIGTTVVNVREDIIGLKGAVADLQAKLAAAPPEDPELTALVDALALKVDGLAGNLSALDDMTPNAPAPAPAEEATTTTNASDKKSN